MRPKIITKVAFAVLIIVCCITGTGCAPTKAFVRTSPSYGQVATQISNLGIINDVVLARDLIGTNDYFCIEDSKSAANFMLRAATAHLMQKGYRVEFANTPFIGAFKNPDLRMEVAAKHKDAINKLYSPFFVSEQAVQDEAYQEALKHIFRRVLMAVEQKGDSPTEVFRRDPSVRESLTTIAQRTKADFVLFAIGNGTVVSKGKQIGQDIASGLLTGILSLGTMVHTAHSVSYLDSFVALVDLRNPEILWSNSFRLRELNPLKERTYLGAWSKCLLYHFPPQRVGESEKKAKAPQDAKRVCAVTSTRAQANRWEPEPIPQLQNYPHRQR